jgi:ParB-like chromosome segregation protein Spo0J
MKEVLDKIKIIPISDILLHEGVVADWTEKLSNNIDHDGIVKNPIIVTRFQGHYIALDGMHRVTALKALGCRDIVVYEVDYNDPSIGLFGWDALILDACPIPSILEAFAKREHLTLTAHDNFPDAVENIRSHRSCFALLTREQKVYEMIMREERYSLDLLIRALKDFEADLDRRNLRIIYVADDQAEITFQQHTNAFSLFKRPFFTKEEVVRRTIEGKILPRKSTRHLFPLRPLRIDIDFILLKEDIDLETKNRLLQSRLTWCLENNMVRYYPESVLVLSD